ncbi:MAG: MBOAT family protein [Anaerolinea sp.]|nr:MBOAT family protein [Anaerolinea sp.]
MAITSATFVLFVAVTLAVYFCLPRRWPAGWLLLTSYAFCLSWAWQFALALLLLTTANYALARCLESSQQRRRALLGAGIGLNVLALVYFRSANFFVPQLLALWEPFAPEVVQILVPVGLSYYVLELISYQADVYRGLVTAVTNPLHFALYLAYFPKLLAGPIERARDFLPRLQQPQVVDNSVVAGGLTLIIVGAVRKLLIADILRNAIPPEVFLYPWAFSAPELWGWLLAYGFALYNDFAGYTSIVRGVSRLFGIELSSNFAQPYFARSFTEFWRSWHITLSEWLRDYIYFPISRSLLRRRRQRNHWANVTLPPLVTMLVSGLWHGFSGHMLLWGGLHGVYQIGERLLALRGPMLPPQKRSWWRQGVATAVVFILVMLAWVPFRLEFLLALEYWRGLFSWSDWSIQHRRIVFVVPLVLFSVGLDWAQNYRHDEVVFLRWPRPIQAALLAAAIFLILIVTQGEEREPFVYQSF